MTDIVTQAEAAGLVPKIIEIEKQVAEKVREAKALQADADKLRADLLEGMKGLQLKTLKHENGMRVTVTKTRKVSVLDVDALIADLKEKKLVNFIDKIPAQKIPAYEAVNVPLFKKYLEGAAWKPGDFKGLDFKTSEHITIGK